MSSFDHRELRGHFDRYLPLPSSIFMTFRHFEKKKTYHILRALYVAGIFNYFFLINPMKSQVWLLMPSTLGCQGKRIAFN